MDELNKLFKNLKRITIEVPNHNNLLYESDNNNFKEPKPNSRKAFSDEDITTKELNGLFEAYINLIESNEFENAVDEKNYEDEVYKKYDFKQDNSTENQLPIASSKAILLKSIDKNPVIVVQGDTGCGKSTQLPQMILDDCREREKFCNIIVTQPRRIAARSIAERVSRERGWPLGTVVGYQIALDSKFVSADTRITYCTTGLLLEKLCAAKSLSHYTHIVLDEVHERDKHMDFLLVVIRILLCTVSPNVKIIVMSATLDAKKFSKYFFLPKGPKFELVSAPVISIDQKRLYKISNHFLDDIPPQVVRNIEFSGTAAISENMYELALRLLIAWNYLEKESSPEMSASVLIFLPGIYEINNMHKLLLKHTSSHGKDWKVFLLHSAIGMEEQRLIFNPSPPNVRKIILTTNIAESSITVPDVGYVIDFCLTKVIRTNPANNFTSLRLEWCSKNNCQQRSGRAGRVRAGRCYRFVTREFFNKMMKESADPEMLRSPLENIVLKAKLLDLGSPHRILSLALDPPKLVDIEKTVLILKEIGAMLVGERNPFDGEITFIGRIMAKLPLDVRLSRLILIGYCYSVLDECIIMAAGLTVKSIFSHSLNDIMTHYARKLEWSNGSGSDLFAIYNAYRVWTFKHNTSAFGEGNEKRYKEREFGNKNFLEIRSLHECHLLIEEIKSRLDKLGIFATSGVDRVIWTENQKSIILKLVIGGAFYPNIFIRSISTENNVERDISNVLDGRDPQKTVFLQGFRNDYVRELYVGEIKKLFCPHVVNEDELDCVNVSFVRGSERICVSFDDNGIKNPNTLDGSGIESTSLPGKISSSVYKALKMKSANVPMTIYVAAASHAYNHCKRLGLKFDQTLSFEKPLLKDCCLPKLREKTINGYVSHFENCTQFWIQPRKERQRVLDIFHQINSKTFPLERFSDVSELNENDVIAATVRRFDNSFVRAKILGSNKKKECDDQLIVFLVSCIDYGFTEECNLSDLRRMVDTELRTLAPRCFECCLAETQPALMYSESHVWSKDANEYFTFLLENASNNVSIEVFSVVHGIAHVYVHAMGDNLNDVLIKNGFGESCEEDYLSKQSHWRRQSRQECQWNSGDDYEIEHQIHERPMAEVEPPARDMCSTKVVLKGPFSPLTASIYSTLKCNSHQKIRIDTLSVNSVMLDNCVHDHSIKHVVAASVSQQNINDGDLILRETTMLPNLRGCGPLIAMMFCPKLTMKRDKTKSHYKTILTGLGWNKQNDCPEFEEHDCVFNLDVKFSQDDFDKINQLRYCFDKLLFTHKGQDKNDNISLAEKANVMKKIKDLTIELLTEQREPLAPEFEPLQWNEFNSNEMIKAKKVFIDRAVFPQHDTLKLYPKEETNLLKLRENCEEIHCFARGLSATTGITKCQLCSMEFSDIRELQTHLMSRLHLIREKEIGFQPNKC